MQTLKFRSILAGMILLCLIFVGCKDIIISGTAIFVKTFDFTAQSGFYYYRFDITDDPDWEKYSEDIDFVDAVGVELFITSTEPGDVNFNAYIDDYTEDLEPIPEAVPGSATQIIENLVVSPGETFVSYKESLKFLRGLNRLKALAKVGKFDYYGTSTGNIGTSFVVDSARVIVTLSGSKESL